MVQLKAVAHRKREENDWIIRYFPIGRHCTIEIYVGGHHTWASFAAERDIGKPRGFSNVSETWPLISSVRPTASIPLHPLWTLRINRVSRVYFRFRIQSYVSLLTARRITELTRNPSFHFNMYVMQFRSGFYFHFIFHVYRNFILYLQTFCLIFNLQIF